MRQPQSFGETVPPLVVVDTSVVINLNATGRANDIVRAFGVTLCASGVVRDELFLDRLNGRDDAGLAQLLVKDGLLEFLPFDVESESLFESLVAGPAEKTLDDGEAATLALAAAWSGVAIIDERKAIKIAGDRFPDLQLRTTADILRSDRVFAALGRAEVAEAVFNGLKEARMAVPAFHHDWLVGLLGERIVECRSLPAALRQIFE
ncbi:hypothetical protein ACFFTN_09780 [Aminobacter aganoensis]|uniref:Putative nucleic acid-binding protein n=1 Tax=Aminobacter aganoensis TaxID=83264 RepID=A0A7X0FAU5_9HYPH|nr:hypothetical protein [Aminobacter aganoensis]MBB6356317.1 putative nucleic acid-binding protein [Aminobacter aganoensis]